MKNDNKFKRFPKMKFINQDQTARGAQTTCETKTKITKFAKDLHVLIKNKIVAAFYEEKVQ